MMRKARQQRAEGEFRIDVATRCEDALAELDILKSMHQSRWESKGIEGCFSNENFSRFVSDCVARQWGHGRAILAMLRWEGTPAAGMVCFRDESTLSVYVTSMDPKFSEHKPGWKMHGFMADYALAHGCSTIDYMRGDEIYKQRLGADAASQQRWLIASPRLRGRVHRAIYQTARELRNYWGSPIAANAAIPEPQLD
jgi:CelD/BcsL family acetyltransferase involved in cellulose biosynthesis